MKTKKNNSQQTIGFILLLSGLFFVLLTLVYDSNDGSKNKNEKKINAEKNYLFNTVKSPNDLVNEHLQKTYDNEQIKKLNTIHQNEILAPSLEQAREEVPFQEDMSISFETDDLSSLVGKDLNKDIRQSWEDTTLHNKIEEELSNDQKNAIATKLYRDAYAKAYIQKAKDKGYQVQLDDEFRVISVKKIIEKKKGKSIFELENSEFDETPKK